MNSEAKKTDIFLESINKDAEALCDKIRRDADTFVVNELEKARVRAHEDVKAFKKSEIDRLNEENNAGFSELEMQETKIVLDRRTQITNDIFSRAETKLIEFTKSGKYLDFLKASIAAIETAIGDDSVILLKPDDKKFEAELKGLCKEIKYDATIKIGGCKAENIDNRLIADDTLDTRLEGEKADFYKNSGLTLTL